MEIILKRLSKKSMKKMLSMNKVIIVNKEKGYTSRDVVNKLNKILKTKKIGHTGTLDPIATGVLVVCVNEATKLCELLTSSFKEYEAVIKLGIKTDTGDITGKILEKSSYPKYTLAKIKQVLESFLGKSSQEVPIYSAVKVKGKKLYEYARNHEEVVLPKRKIEIKEIKLLEYNDDIIKFRVLVSKGTYIRSLIEDICSKLGTIGTMSDLVRLKQGPFKIEDSYTLKQIENNEYKALSLKEVLSNFPQKNLTLEEYTQIKNGALIKNEDNEPYTVLLYIDEVVSISQIYAKNKRQKKPYKIFNI